MIERKNDWRERKEEGLFRKIKVAKVKQKVIVKTINIQKNNNKYQGLISSSINDIQN